MFIDLVFLILVGVVAFAIGWTLRDAVCASQGHFEPTPDHPTGPPYELQDMAIRDDGIRLIYGVDAYDWWVRRANDPIVERARLSLEDYAWLVTHEKINSADHRPDPQTDTTPHQ